MLMKTEIGGLSRWTHSFSQRFGIFSVESHGVRSVRVFTGSRASTINSHVFSGLIRSLSFQFRSGLVVDNRSRSSLSVRYLWRFLVESPLGMEIMAPEEHRSRREASLLNILLRIPFRPKPIRTISGVLELISRFEFEFRRRGNYNF